MIDFAHLCIAFLLAAIPTQTDSPVTMAMETTSCYGVCPVYELAIHEDGTVRFHGKAHVSPLGHYTAKLNILEMEYFKQEFDKVGFFSLKDEYTASVSDLPTTYLYYKKDGQEKKIMDYHGAPAALRALEEKIAALIDNLSWQEAEQKNKE